MPIFRCCEAIGLINLGKLYGPCFLGILYKIAQGIYPVDFIYNSQKTRAICIDDVFIIYLGVL